MPKIFRTARKENAKENRLSSYAIYAIGEIALVMIGILLALQVNNLNEKRKNKNQLQTILNTVWLDLKTDTIRANAVVQFYDTINKKSELVLQKEYTRENFQQCPLCRSVATIYQPFVIQKKGFELLEKFGENNDMKNDTLVNNITQFYSSFILLVDDSNAFVKEQVLKNIESFQQEEWFVAWSQGKSTPKMITYFTESTAYRNMVAANNILAVKNHQSFAKIYKSQAAKFLEKLEERLEKDD